MSEMDARLEQLFHGYDCHNAKSSFGFTLCRSCTPNVIFDGISANRSLRHPAEQRSRMCFAAIVYHGYCKMASLRTNFGTFTPSEPERLRFLGRFYEGLLFSAEYAAQNPIFPGSRTGAAWR